MDIIYTVYSRKTLFILNVKAQDVDLHAQGNEFRFFLRPYFLRYITNKIIKKKAVIFDLNIIY